MKVSELEGAALDFWVGRADMRAVALIDGCCWVPLDPRSVDTTDGAMFFAGDGWCRPYSPSSDWGVGGPIIERERIMLAHGELNSGSAWVAHYGVGSGAHRGIGKTPPIAAMRLFVLSKYGVEVPDA